MRSPDTARRLRRVVFVGLFVLSGCARKAPAPSPDAGCSCEGHVCGSVCGVSCGACTDDAVCSDGGTSCRPALPIGSPCQQDLDCGENRVCLTTATVNVPGGYCTKPCGFEPEDAGTIDAGDAGSTDCPTGSSCEVVDGGQQLCLATCSASAPCRTDDGYACSGRGFCPACVGQCTGLTCGDDGCGNQCGQMMPSIPVCNGDGQVCSSGQCVAGFTNAGRLDNPSGAFVYTYGLWDAAAFDIDGMAVIVGGREAYQYPDATLGAVSVSTVSVYDPSTNEISSTWPDMPVDVARPQAAVLDGVIYVAGGISDPMMMPATPPLESNDTPQPAFFRYNGIEPGMQSWDTTLAPVPIPFPTGSSLVALNGLLYLIAGTVDGAPSTRVDVYDPTANAWNQPAAPPQRTVARTMFAAVSDGTYIYVIGGTDGMQALATVEVLDPASGWTTAIDLAQPVVDARAVIIGNSIYVFGGRLGPVPYADVVADIETIDLTTRQTAVIGRTDEFLSGQAPVILRTGEVLLFGALRLSDTEEPIADTEVLGFNVPMSP